MTDNQKAQIIKLRAAGNGYGKIAQTIGISVNTVKSFCGRTKETCTDEWVKVEEMHEAIVSKEEFRQVQDTFSEQAPASPFRKQHYRCGICGRGLNRRNGENLYCARVYFLKEECECRSVKEKEPYMDELVLRNLKAKLKRVMDAEEMKLKKKSGKAAGVDTVHSLKSALESARKAKQTLFEKLADRSIDRETFKEKKQVYDSEIEALEQKLSDANMAEQLARDSDNEADEKIETAKSFLEVMEMTEEMWERFVKDVFLYPGGRMEIHWNFDE